jgi:hypothetical protein
LTSAVGLAIERLLILQMTDAHFRRGSAGHVARLALEILHFSMGIEPGSRRPAMDVAAH